MKKIVVALATFVGAQCMACTNGNGQTGNDRAFAHISLCESKNLNSSKDSLKGNGYGGGVGKTKSGMGTGGTGN